MGIEQGHSRLVWRYDLRTERQAILLKIPVSFGENEIMSCDLLLNKCT